MCTRTLNRISYEDILHPKRLSVSPSLQFLTTAKFGNEQQLNLEFFKLRNAVVTLGKCLKEQLSFKSH